MSKPLKTPPASTPPDSAARRTAKLEAALRENLKKRKDKPKGSAVKQPVDDEG
jgi:hypothetical protein